MNEKPVLPPPERDERGRTVVVAIHVWDTSQGGGPVKKEFFSGRIGPQKKGDDDL